MDFKNEISNYLKEEIEIISNLDVSAINDAMNLLEETRNNGTTVYLIGNGGSAATASHMQNDFNKGISEGLEKKYNFCCLCDNFATIMAIANDDCYENVFYNQLLNRLKPGDVVLAISGSGNSKNVIKAVEYAKSKGNKVIGFTGYDGGKLKSLSDISLHVPLNNMQIAEDVHTIFNHTMMYVLCNLLKTNKY
jgi:D-sedoheptulose 7-phosphate isomerase